LKYVAFPEATERGVGIVKEYDLSRLKFLVIEPHELMRNLIRDVFKTLKVE